MFSKTLTQAGHTRRFDVTARQSDGWEVRIEQDSQVVRQVLYTDWHRVERAMDSIGRQVDDLESQGWRPTAGGREADDRDGRDADR